MFHDLLLHLLLSEQQFSGKSGCWLVTEGVSDRLLCLPFYHELSEAEQARVVAATSEFAEGKSLTECSFLSQDGL